MPSVSSDPSSPAASSTRQLSDGVLQSAEEAVVHEFNEPEGKTVNGAKGITAETWESAEGLHGLDEDDFDLPASASRQANVIRRLVAQRPGQSALVAAAAGALAMIVLRAQLRKQHWPVIGRRHR